MSADWIATLMFVTLAIGAGVGLLMLFSFMQRRSNRRIAEEALTGDGSGRDSGALPELAGVGAVALVAMALLTVGYSSRPHTADDPTPVSVDGKSSDSAAELMTDPALPRANPAEKSQPPTQYPLGSGSPATAPTEPARP